MYILNGKSGTLHAVGCCCHTRIGFSERLLFATEAEAAAHAGRRLRLCKVCEKNREEMQKPPATDK